MQISSSHNFLKHSTVKPFVWILIPHLQSGDANVDYYYDFTQSIEEYTRAFAEMGIPWKWQPLTMEDYVSVLEGIARSATPGSFPLVLNLCDGDEINGTPGISVIRELDRLGLVYTGSDTFFYEITTSKIPMKKAFDLAGVPTPAWRVITGNGQSLHQIFEALGKPLIVKPAVSGGSMGVGVKSVVHTQVELSAQLKLLFDGYRGWDLTIGGVLAEQYIAGPEFTSLIVGDCDDAESCIVYPPVERVFHASLPDNEKFLSFDRLWETYDEESPLPNDEPFYTYHPPEAELVAEISRISWEAYVAVGGKGYGRVDLRMDQAGGALYVLEVNAQCGLSEDEDYTSIGAILRLGNKTFAQLVAEILNNACERHLVRKAATAAIVRPINAGRRSRPAAKTQKR